MCGRSRRLQILFQTRVYHIWGRVYHIWEEIVIVLWRGLTFGILSVILASEARITSLDNASAFQ